VGLTSRDSAGIVAKMIAANPGRTLDQLAATSGLFRGEIASAINTFGSTVELRNDGRFYLRDRRKPKRPPTILGRLRRLLGA
jgi:hypothetical protein